MAHTIKSFAAIRRDASRFEDKSAESTTVNEKPIRYSDPLDMIAVSSATIFLKVTVTPRITVMITKSLGKSIALMSNLKPNA